MATAVEGVLPDNLTAEADFDLHSTAFSYAHDHFSLN